MLEDLIKHQDDCIMKVISVEDADNPKFIDKKIIDRCQMLIENPGFNEAKIFCFDGEPRLRFGPLTTREVNDGDVTKVYFEQTLEILN